MTARHSRRDILIGAGGLALGGPLLGLVACDDAPAPTTRLAGTTMGTSYAVTVARAMPDAERESLRAEIEAILQAIDSRMSTWRATSQVSRFNAAAPGAWIPISADTGTVLDEARRIALWSGGAFDPTIGRLVDLWGFGAGSRAPGIPPPEAISAERDALGFGNVRFRETAAIAKRRAGTVLDLSGIAKGYAVDRVAERLERRGMSGFLVEIGGELRAGGANPRGRTWRIGIERPVAGRRAIQRVVGLDRGGIATSGDYRIFFERDGTRYSHVLDPRTGAPVEHGLASVTVIAPTCMRADALSTALMVLGVGDGMRRAGADDIAALFVVADRGRLVELPSPAFADRFPARGAG